ncbi:MAG: hypothetical protein DRP70_12485 [Spirochaetes bacterium]|nr:MAG: hypothetical protein DRP70_12485 [Spirochaetota bacterium]RKX92522.1 MAG: hypothetical protein DRZ90_13785 [Spirochaetota bacterium]
MRLFDGLEPYIKNDEGRSDMLVVILLFTAALSSLIPAFLSRVFFDRVIPDRRTGLILPIFFLLILVESAGIFSRFQADRLLAERSREFRHRRRILLVNRLWKLRLGWFHINGPGAIVRHYDDAGILGDLRRTFIREIVGPSLVLIVLLPPMFLLHPVLALSRLATILPSLFIGFVFLKTDLEYERRIWSVRKRLTTDLFRGARGAATLKSGGGGTGYARYLRNILNTLGKVEQKRRVLGAGWEAAAAGSSRIGGALILVLAVYLVISGQLTFGSYIAFSILSSRVLSSAGELLGGIRSMARSGNSAGRHRELFLQETDESQFSYPLYQPASRRAGLSVTGLSFAYPGSGNVLRSLNLKVEDSERVLIAGGSGAGKSTLFSLLLGFQSPTSGRIDFSGSALHDCTLSRRRELVGAVLQNPAFFDGTVRENLCLYAPSPSDARLWAALESAAAEDIVARLPGGLDARLSGEDSGLSGGQRQRLAIARLMVHPPSLILLDEPVNALDSLSSKRVRLSLEAACRGKTVLLISHSRELPLQVHRRVFLSGGCIQTEENND